MSSVRITKTMNYRGAPRTFSNRYHIGTTHPVDDSHWNALISAIAAAEAPMFLALASGGAKIILGEGIVGGSNIPVHSSVLSLDGSLSIAAPPVAPGDAAAIVRYTTPDRSSKNHPVYLFSYYHTVMNQGSAGADLLVVAQKTALQTYADHWISGFTDGSTVYKRSRPNVGTLATAAVVSPEITHRDLPR